MINGTCSWGCITAQRTRLHNFNAHSQAYVMHTSSNEAPAQKEGVRSCCTRIGYVVNWDPCHSQFVQRSLAFGAVQRSHNSCFYFTVSQSTSIFKCSVTGHFCEIRIIWLRGIELFLRLAETRHAHTHDKNTATFWGWRRHD